MHEIEIKVLNVDANIIEERLIKLGAKETQRSKLTVDWFGPKGLTHNGDDPWFLRIRSYGTEKVEVTWKGIPETISIARKVREINVDVLDHQKMAQIFLALDLELYAHQEKQRISWVLKNWKFDLDQYPNMPAYLEIEGHGENEIKEALKLLSLQNNKTSSEGERSLTQSEYNLNWFDMKF